MNDSFAPGDRRFSYNNKNAAVELSNTTASAYNQQRLLRSLILTDDLGGTLDYIFDDATFQSRWYEQGVTPAAAEYTGWTYTLTRGGNVVDNFSATEDTTITVQVDTAAVGKIRTIPNFLIYRQDSPLEGFGYFKDLETSYYCGPTLIAGGVSVSSQTNWTLVAGTIYETTYTIDSSYLALNGEYRIVIGVADDTGVSYLFHNSFITNPIIVVDAPPPPTTGTMSGTISDYNDIYTGNCLQVTARERLEICTQVDKASYDAELLVNGADGDFDTNLNTVQVTIVDFLNAETLVNINTTAGDPNLTVNDNATFYEVCIGYRIPEDRLNRPLLVNFIFNYDLIATATQVAYKDIITYTQILNADRLEENKDTPLITDITFLQGGNPIIEICDDSTEEIEVVVDVDASLNGYNLIALIKQDVESGGINEHEAYDNNVLPQLVEPPITSVDTNFAGGTASFFIDPTQLQTGQKYRVYAIAKEAQTPQPFCPIITLDAITEVTSTGMVGPDEVTTLQCDFVITNLGAATIATVDINTQVSGPSITGANQNDNFVAVSSGNYNYIITFEGGFRGTPATLTQTYDIVLSNGCTYSGRIVIHAILPILNNITQDVSQQDAD